MENIEYVLPGEIEKRSFAIIGEAVAVVARLSKQLSK